MAKKKIGGRAKLASKKKVGGKAKIASKKKVAVQKPTANAAPPKATTKNAPVARASTKNAARAAKATTKNAPVARASTKNAPVARASTKNAPVARASAKNAPVARASAKNAPVARASAKNAPVARASGAAQSTAASMAAAVTRAAAQAKSVAPSVPNFTAATQAPPPPPAPLPSPSPAPPPALPPAPTLPASPATASGTVSTIMPAQANPTAAAIDFPAFFAGLHRVVEGSRLSKVKSMLAAERFQLYTDLSDDALVGVVASQSEPGLFYSARLTRDGDYACCTQNLFPCGGLRGALCKHLLVLICGLTRAGQLDPGRATSWIEASGKKRPALDKDVMSQTFLRHKGAQAGEVDWRPTETVPEDFFAL